MTEAEPLSGKMFEVRPRTRNMIKNVIFDWSGVINDDLVTVYKAIMAIFQKLGAKEISLEEFKREWEQPHMRYLFNL